jgi:hypothetical protein
MCMVMSRSRLTWSVDTYGLYDSLFGQHDGRGHVPDHFRHLREDRGGIGLEPEARAPRLHYAFRKNWTMYFTRFN